MGFEEWTKVERIGRGSFGTVWKIKREKHGYTQYAAMKEIRIERTGYIYDDNLFDSPEEYNDALVKKILAEVETMNKVKGHTNIVNYEDHDAERMADGSWVIRIRMELLTPLKQYIRERVLTVDEVLKIGTDLCNALVVCEKHGILHRDVKLDNVFVNDSGDYKLGDFGTAKVLSAVQTRYTSAGTMAYMAPEVLLSEPYDARADQ